MPELDTTELRALADRLAALHADDHGVKGDALFEGAAALRAAADTIDALRAELNAAHAQVEVRARANDRLWTRAVSAEAERAALRRIIAEAPHTWNCAAFGYGHARVEHPERCDCFKSRIEETR